MKPTDPPRPPDDDSDRPKAEEGRQDKRTPAGQDRQQRPPDRHIGSDPCGPSSPSRWLPRHLPIEHELARLADDGNQNFGEEP